MAFGRRASLKCRVYVVMAREKGAAADSHIPRPAGRDRLPKGKVFPHKPRSEKLTLY
jgi:hypothetical protein